MDALITIVRFPFGVAVIPLIALLWLSIWPLEFVAGIVALPVAAVIMGRQEIKNSWLGEWPYISVRRIAEDSGKVWHWIFSD